ncbi:hypothetical protein JQ615_00910 [Bradyrhizobium jicamae]|uniref:SIS domain-containing protein n=1 Tax=Bradyrhizobium jicamae TaxID=280332 RepID=A0ABS5FAY4_9BRAD|nr:hypothetical protein [Bradyrhizobium jicamae]MBR0793941.1 hypothetical protein [Bradyrhizobium jicamae]MBR0932126.1 hypothetical protein [Bradyrhizobium jicamae]
MSKARLHVILCTDDDEPDVMRRSSGFRPSVIDGGKGATDAVVDDAPWSDLLELFNLGLLVSQVSYFTLLEASLAALEPEARVRADRVEETRR